MTLSDLASIDRGRQLITYPTDAPDMRTVFAINFCNLLIARGLRQSDVCRALQVTSSTVNDWTTGRNYPRVDALERLAKFLGVRASALTEMNPAACTTERADKDERETEATHMTLTEIEAIDRDYLIPSEVAPILGCDQYAINVAARQQPEALGFAVVRVGNRVKIPKAAFLHFMRYGNAPIAEDHAQG